MSAEHVALETRQLYTVEDQDFVAALNGAIELPRGAIVRIKPPEGATDEQAEFVRQRLLAAGMAAARVVDRAKAAVVTQAQHQEELPAASGAREAAMALVDAAATRDRDALRDAVDRALSAGGL